MSSCTEVSSTGILKTKLFFVRRYNGFGVAWMSCAVLLVVRTDLGSSVTGGDCVHTTLTLPYLCSLYELCV